MADSTTPLHNDTVALRELIETRLDSMDKASVVLSDNVNRVPTLLDREILRVSQLNDEKFNTIRQRLDEMEQRYKQQFDAQQRSLVLAAASDDKIDANMRHQIGDVYKIIDESTIKAQVANDALERLLDTNIKAVEAVAVSRFIAADTAISKTDVAITKAHDAAGAIIRAVEAKVTAHILALQQLVDQRSRMGEVAIAKAEQATEIRFASVNEFRGQLSDQTRQFVTTNVLDARLEQIGSNKIGYEIQISDVKERVSKLETIRVSEHDGKVDNRMTIGSVTGIAGAAVGVIMMVIAVGGILISNRGRDPQPNPIVSADTKRVDDLLSRLDAIQRQIQNNADRK